MKRLIILSVLAFVFTFTIGFFPTNAVMRRILSTKLLLILLKLILYLFLMLKNMLLEFMKEGVLLSLKMVKLRNTIQEELLILLIVMGLFKDIQL